MSDSEESNSSAEDAPPTIGTDSEMTSEDENGKYITEDTDLQLFHLLKSIRNDDGKLYESKENWFSESHPELSNEVNKEQLVNEYFDSLVAENDEKKKKKKKKRTKKSERKKINAVPDENLTEEDLFLKQFLLSEAWKKPNNAAATNYKKIQEEELQQLEFENSNNIEMEDSKKSDEEAEEDVPRYRFEEAGGLGIVSYPKFTAKEGSVREKKISRKKKSRLTRNENYRIKLSQDNIEGEQKRAKIKKEIIGLVSDLRKLQTSELLESLNLEDENIFDQIERHKVYEALVTVTINEEEDDEEQTKMIKEIKRNIRRKFEEFYETYYESREGDLKFRFKYRTVEKDNFGLGVDEILHYDDELLEKVVPTHDIRVSDSIGKKLDKKLVEKNVQKLKHTRTDVLKRIGSQTPIEKKKKMKAITRVKGRKRIQ